MKLSKKNISGFLHPVRAAALLAALFTTCTFSSAQSQYGYSSHVLLIGDSSVATAGIYGDGISNSSALNNNFFRQFNKDGNISPELKNEISSTLKTFNRLGGDVNYGLFYQHRLNKSWNYFMSLSDRFHFDILFTKDLFDLTFYGNKKFAGDTAFLDSTSANYLRFQQFQQGMVYTSSGNKKIGFALALLKGEEYFSMKLNRGRLYTAENGEYIFADFNAEIYQSDTSSKGIDAINGWGISSDFFMSFPFSENKSLIIIEVNDLGFIRWNENTLQNKKDTSVYFDGIDVNNIFELNDSVIKSMSPDTIANELQSSREKKEINSYLPSYLRLKYSYHWNKVNLSIGFTHRVKAAFLPMAGIKAGYRINEFFTAGTGISYGGYGKLNMSLETQFSFKGFSLLAGTNTLEGIFAPKYSGGNSAYLCLKKDF